MKRPSREQVLRFLVATGVVFVIAFLCRLVHVNPTTVALALLLGVLIISAVWGLAASIFMAVLATLVFNYFFLPPIGTFTITDPQNWVALTAFLVTAITASRLSEQARREARDANRRRREVERLYAFTQQLLVAGNVVELLNAIPRRIVESFEVQDVALYLANKNEVYRSGGNFRDLDAERLKTVMARGEPVLEAEHQRCFTPVRMGVRPVGTLGISGAVLSRQTLEALGSLIAIAVERANVVEALSKAEAARQEERLRSALVDSVTHALRSPLTGIKAAITSILSQPQLSEVQRQELLSVINEESDHLNRLIEEALEMARLDAGEIELKIEPHSIRAALDAAVEDCKHSLAGHPLDVKLPENLPALPMDLARVKEVLWHLLDNAAKYSPPDAPIHVSSELSGQFLVTSVADHGVGIDSFEQGLIFDKFYRGKDQRSRVQGTGMGLAICRAIAEAHGGTLAVTSQVGIGSVFHLSLPLTSEGARG